MQKINEKLLININNHRQKMQHLIFVKVHSYWSTEKQNVAPMVINISILYVKKRTQLLTTRKLLTFGLILTHICWCYNYFYMHVYYNYDLNTGAWLYKICKYCTDTKIVFRPTSSSLISTADSFTLWAIKSGHVYICL